MADTNISAGPIEIRMRPIGVFSHLPAADRDYTLDGFIDMEDYPIEIVMSQIGEMSTVSIDSPFIPLAVDITGEWLEGITIDAGPIDITLSLKSDYFIVSKARDNWVIWSRVGRPDFTIGLDSVAGERPMDWAGFVYDILKLSKSVIVYGANGVSVLSPVEAVWSMQTVHRLGLINKGAVCGTGDTHFFIDTQYRLYKLSQEGLKLLDYSEYLSDMETIVMSLDIENNLVYICDGEIGYVYSILSESFGEGPATITGAGYKDGNLYVVSPTAIEMPKLDICTDIYDLNTRTPKTIQSIEIGTNLTEHLEVMIESRLSNKGDFIKSKWALVNPNGIAHIPCYGVEFKFHIRSYIYEAMEIDYIKVNGVFHEYNYVQSAGIQ